MHRFFLALFLVLFSTHANSSDLAEEVNLYIVNHNSGEVMMEKGDCLKRYSPLSTAKPAIALMGYDQKILINKDEPLVPFKKEYLEWLATAPKEMQDMLYPSHGQDLTPALWMSVSAVWYSQHITQKMDVASFQGYLEKFSYGNKDMTDGGLVNCWINRSLEISAKEQTGFIGKLISDDAHKQLLVSQDAVLRTKEIMQISGSPISTFVVPAGSLPEGWHLFGKTGGWAKGWFVGWVEKGEKKLTFACYIDPKREVKGPVGRDIAFPLVLKSLSQIIAEKKL